MNELNHYVQLASVDVSKEIEKKQNLSYLSWAFAVDKLMRHDPQANWEFHSPEMYGDTMMISCTVTVFGKPIKMHLPVMDHKNNAIKNPDAFAVNKNMMRCLVKAIACHGLGINVYAGEDLPLDEDGHATKPGKAAPPAKAPTKVEGKDTPWQLKVVAKPDGDHGEWSQLIIDATMLQLQQVKTEADVMSVFKTNRNIYDEVKAGSPNAYEVLMDEFKQARAKHKEAA